MVIEDTPEKPASLQKECSTGYLFEQGMEVIEPSGCSHKLQPGQPYSVISRRLVAVVSDKVSRVAR